MKITVIGPTHPYKGGISHFTTILVRELRKKHQVDFISWKRQYPAFLYPVELKDTESKQPIKEDAIFLLDFLNPITWFQTVSEIKKNKSEKLILTWVSPISAPIYFIISALTKFLTKTEIIYICHNVLPHEGTQVDKPLAKLALSLGQTFIVHARDDKKILENLVKNKRIILSFHPIYNVFNTGKKYDVKKIKKELKLKEKVLLFFGYIRPYKGVKYLIEAMPDILKTFPDLSLLVVGEFWSKDKQSYLDLVKELNLEKDVVFVTKYIPNEEVGKYFSVADVTVFPYTSATQSGTIQVARAFNKPVISTLVGGLKDVFKDNEVIDIKSKDSRDISEKVKLFYTKKIPKNNNFKQKKDKFSWDKYIVNIAN